MSNVTKEYSMRSRDVAQIIDCSPDDVIIAARRGQLIGKKQGRFWRFRLSDVRAWKKQLAKSA
jgi:hypothetical protein